MCQRQTRTGLHQNDGFGFHNYGTLTICAESMVSCFATLEKPSTEASLGVWDRSCSIAGRMKKAIV